MAKAKEVSGINSLDSAFDISSHPDFFRFVTDVMNVDKKIDVEGLTAEFDEDEQTTNVVAGRKLTYVKSRVLRKRLRDFTGGNYSFMILSERRISDPLPRYDRDTKEYVDSPAYIKVVAMLAIPGLGVQIQYGVKQTFGVGESNDWKAAATDAFKKCCQGFGLEATYDEDTEDNPSTGNNKAPQKTDDELEDALDELEFDQETYEEALEEEVTFGKHKGLTLGEIWDEDPSYVEWIAKNARDEEMQEYGLMVIKGKREEEGSKRKKKANNKKQETKAKPEPKKNEKRRPPKEEEPEDEDDELIDDEEEEEAPPPKKGNKKK